MGLKGTVEKLSKSTHGVKIKEEERWLNAEDEPVQNALAWVRVGQEVEYSKDGKALTYIRGTGKRTSEGAVPVEADFDQAMRDAIESVVEMTGLVKDAEMRKNIDWTKVIISLFIAKTSR